MKKNDVRVKEFIDFQEQIDFINILASSYFTETDEGEVEYTPYMEPFILKMLFFQYFVDGLTVEPVDEEGNIITMEDALELYDHDESLIMYESLLAAVEADPEVNVLFEQYVPGGKTKMDDVIDAMRLNAKDIVEFRKSQMIHRRSDEFAQIAYGLGEIGKLLSAMNFDQIDPVVAVQALATGLAKSPEFDKIVDSLKEIPFEEVNTDEDRNDQA